VSSHLLYATETLSGKITRILVSENQYNEPGI